MLLTHQIPSEVRIQKARTTLLLDHPFFGTLLFRDGIPGRAPRSSWRCNRHTFAGRLFMAGGISARLPN